MAEPVRYHSGKFPPKDLDWPRLIPLIGPASASLARYDGVLSSIPNAAILLSPLTTQEAVLSSRIEGTQATMTEVLEFEADESIIADFSGAKKRGYQGGSQLSTSGAQRFGDAQDLAAFTTHFKGSSPGAA